MDSIKFKYAFFFILIITIKIKGDNKKMESKKLEKLVELLEEFKKNYSLGMSAMGEMDAFNCTKAIVLDVLTHKLYPNK